MLKSKKTKDTISKCNALDANICRNMLDLGLNYADWNKIHKCLEEIKKILNKEE